MIYMEKKNVCDKYFKITNAVCELEEVAFGVLETNMGCCKKVFISKLVEEYKDLIILAYGCNPEKIKESLIKLWDTPYYDPNRNKEKTLKNWSIYFKRLNKQLNNMINIK